MNDTHEKPVVIVVTSETSWKNLAQFCFNGAFLKHRASFNLAVIFNGDDSEGLAWIRSAAGPQHLLQRRNLGMDLAGFDYALKRLPPYNQYLLLHDDHWFVDDHWPDLFRKLSADGSADVLGNIIPSEAAPPPHHRFISTALGYSRYQLETFPHFLQGLAGFYKKKAIDCVLAHGGVPHLLDNHRETTFVCERIHSFIMLDNAIKFGQIPPGCQKYLKHRYH